MDQPSLERLIAAIVSYAVGHESYVTKTKLLKLLYLFDVEYYRIYRRTFSGFTWKFYHIGPWAAEFDPILNSLVASDVIAEVPSWKPEFETSFYRPTDVVELDSVFPTYKDEALLRGVLNTWGACTTGEILNHVYFRTEPMEYAVRNEPLDFGRDAPAASGTLPGKSGS